MKTNCRFLVVLLAFPVVGAFAQGPKWEEYEWIQGATLESKDFTFSRPFSSGSDDAFVTRNSEVTIKYYVPKPLTKPESFEQLNASIFTALPGLEEMIKGAKVSPLYASFYEEKAKIFGGGGSIDQYNYFDCASVLEGTLPESGETFLILQTDMDVDTDGTDSLRFPKVEDYEQALVSKTYQPELSYSWWGGNSLPKNPLIEFYSNANTYLVDREKEFQSEAEKATAFHERRALAAIAAETRDLAGHYERLAKTYQRVYEEKRRSLVGGKDPFIVIPGNWDKYKPSDKEGTIERGSLAAVIAGGTIYPAIVGDSGVDYKMGEASLLIAKTVNEKASGNYRAVTGPRATYIIFPKTGKLDQTRKMPDFDEVQREVKKRLDEIVKEGEKGNYHEWKLGDTGE